MSPAGTDVVTLGETMGLLVPDTGGRLTHVSGMTLGIGGAESNVAIALARLGSSATWFGRLGDDSIGDRVVRELRAEGVTVRAARDPSAPTGLMLKERPPGGGVIVRYYRAAGAGVRLSPGDLDDAAIAAARILHVTGITPALGPGPAAAVEHAVEVARAAGVTVSVDVNHRPSLWPEDAAVPALRALVGGADMVFAGADEARLVLGDADATPDGLAAGLAALGPAEAVIKLGADGAVASVAGTLHQRPAVEVDVVDPVGAGDAFVGAYLAERLAGRPVADRLLTAAQAGALVCTVPGDWEALPTRADLVRWPSEAGEVSR